MDIVIVKLGEGPIMFYTGANWSAEYPDANQFPNVASAKRSATMLAKKGTSGVIVMADYGLDSEKIFD